VIKQEILSKLANKEDLTQEEIELMLQEFKEAQSNIIDAGHSDEIINDGGLIRGDVNTIRIQNINGGWVAGKISYKRSDEHK